MPQIPAYVYPIDIPYQQGMSFRSTSYSHICAWYQRIDPSRLTVLDAGEQAIFSLFSTAKLKWVTEFVSGGAVTFVGGAKVLNSRNETFDCSNDWLDKV